ncbi:MAG: transposase [Verrucomicrobia bacterium RIFCSPHIGHO2_12_FULL_41_10]|nr:MAG: transposase [Verrucomicrobia bacterium RIFCSPHIGHO2_12_FULL_41_10]
MKKNNVIDLKNLPGVDLLTQLIQDGARQVVAQAMEAEVEVFINAVAERLEDGRARVVRNGYLPARDIMTGVGQVKVQVPRIRDRGEGEEKIRFKSSLIPPYMRRTATLEKVLPLLYLKGLSEADFVEVLAPMFGDEASNLSPGVISRLKTSWEEERLTWSKRSLKEKRYVYWWVDGIGFPARGEERRCVLVVMGVNERGQKELIALEDGFRESTESWLSLLRDLKKRELAAPLLTVGDGALGFWNAVTEVFPQAKHQRCWFHKMENVLDKLPKSQQIKAKSMLHEIWMSATREDAYKAFDAFIAEYGAKYPKAAECLEKDKESMLTFYDFPAEHWVHIRTTNPIESTFATVRNRTYKVKGAFSSQTIVTMTFRLMQSAQKRWIKLRGFHHLDNVIKGIQFKDGKMVENGDKLLTGKQLIQEAA